MFSYSSSQSPYNPAWYLKSTCNKQGVRSSQTVTYLLKKPSIWKALRMALWVMSNVAASFLMPASALGLTSPWEGPWTWTSNQGPEDGLWAGRRALGKHRYWGNAGQHRDRRWRGQTSWKHHSHCFLTSEWNKSKRMSLRGPATGTWAVAARQCLGQSWSCMG